MTLRDWLNGRKLIRLRKAAEGQPLAKFVKTPKHYARPYGQQFCDDPLCYFCRLLEKEKWAEEMEETKP